jgi:hypothetical protein
LELGALLLRVAIGNDSKPMSRDVGKARLDVREESPILFVPLQIHREDAVGLVICYRTLKGEQFTDSGPSLILEGQFSSQISADMLLRQRLPATGEFIGWTGEDFRKVPLEGECGGPFGSFVVNERSVYIEEDHPGFSHNSTELQRQ